MRAGKSCEMRAASWRLHLPHIATGFHLPAVGWSLMKQLVIFTICCLAIKGEVLNLSAYALPEWSPPGKNGVLSKVPPPLPAFWSYNIFLSSSEYSCCAKI